jgi:HK97 family phage prohead protease
VNGTLLQRSVPFKLRDDTQESGDGLTLDGYAAVWNTPTLIDSWEGCFYESIRQGAFKKTLRETTPVMQFDHGHHPLIGSIPIGVYSDLSEDDQGLHVVGRLSDNWLIEPVRSAIADGSVDGMSFRFMVVRDLWTDNAGKQISPADLDMLLWNPGDRGPLNRELVEVKCPEAGPVVFPAYAETSVGVRARSVAALIERDDDMRRQVRATLVRHTSPEVADLDNPNLRREVARALLFGTQTTDAPLDEHPSGTTEDTSEDAPSREGHPAEDTTIDAPPGDGHPSGSATPSAAPLREQIREISALMKERLETITGA